MLGHKNSIKVGSKIYWHKAIQDFQDEEIYNQSSNFTIKDKVRILIHAKGWFFIRDKPINVYSKNTRVISMIKWNKLSFPSTDINIPYPTPV